MFLPLFLLLSAVAIISAAWRQIDESKEARRWLVDNRRYDDDFFNKQN